MRWRTTYTGHCAALRTADGRFTRTPIALCEVQAHVYGAYISQAHVAEQTGDLEPARRQARRAAALKDRFNEDFWLDDQGWLAMGDRAHPGCRRVRGPARPARVFVAAVATVMFVVLLLPLLALRALITTGAARGRTPP